MTEQTGVVAGPFNEDEWYTMLQLRLDKAFNQKLKKKDPALYEEAESIISKKYKEYISKVA